MIKWLKSLFGFDVPDTPVIAQEAPKAKPKAAPAKKTTKKIAPKTKKTTKKVDTTHLEAMTKKELLEVAKLHDIKANASLSKAELVKRVKNG